MQLYHVFPEIISLFLTIVLYIYHHSERTLFNSKQEKFLQNTMIVSIFTVIINIISCLLIINRTPVNTSISKIIHSLWFLLSLLQGSMLLHYVVDFIYQHSPNKYLSFYYHNFIYLINALNFILVLINFKTGCIFSVDKTTFEYIRGPLNTITPIMVLICIVLSQVVLIIERKYQSPEFSKLSGYCPPIIALLLIIQISFRNFQFSGLVGYVVLLFLVYNLATNELLTDSLTGLGNDAVFRNSVEYLFEKKIVFSIIKIKIRSLSDYKKAFDENETNSLINDIASRLTSVKYLLKIFRTSDDEFTIIAPGIDEVACTKLTNEIVDIFSAEWIVGNSVIKLMTDIILLSCPIVADDLSSVINILEYTKRNISYNTKTNASTNNVLLTICDIKTKSLIRRENYILNILKSACLNEEFEYYFQPIYKVSGEYSGTAECLIRLYDKEHNTFIPPSEFIPIAEKYGLIGIIGEYVLNASSKLIRKAINSGITPPIISVNFSARQFFDVNLVKDVISTLNKYAIPPSCIKIEITESFLITNYDTVRIAMDKLVEKGIGFYLDDFGSGFSNIPHYINLPFECIKYDHSLLYSAATNIKTDNLLKAVTPSFNKLGYRIIFEGVEKEDNLSYVASFGDVYVQGYYYSCAMPQEKFEAMLGL